jgi:hypothetical protein
MYIRKPPKIAVIAGTLLRKLRVAVSGAPLAQQAASSERLISRICLGRPQTTSRFEERDREYLGWQQTGDVTAPFVQLAAISPICTCRLVVRKSV